MSRSYLALVNPSLLIWGRLSARMDVAYASKKIGVSEERLSDWESGKSQPSIKQLRKVASAYKQNFAAFFLTEPPEVFQPPVKDFRRHHGTTGQEISPEIVLELHDSLNKRAITLELLEEMQSSVPAFSTVCEMSEAPEQVAGRVRELLGVHLDEQKTWRDSRVAFNEWRKKLEQVGVLVFQSTKLDLGEMRGYSVFFDTLPLLVVNRKDAYAARVFTLLHELTHLMLRGSGLCDLKPRLDVPPHEQRMEVFCNAVAAGVFQDSCRLFCF